MFSAAPNVIRISDSTARPDRSGCLIQPDLALIQPDFGQFFPC